MNRRKGDFEGILLVDKPKGITSHDVVDRLRRKLNMKRIGHAGTLDPMATGLLIMLIGKATKASQYLISLDKIYEGTIKLGIETDSQDADGEVVAEKALPDDLSEEGVRKEMDGFLGDQYQTPPMFSAKKIGGVPLYKLARKGKTVEREPRFIRISNFETLRFELPEIDFKMASSKGTYVRTIAHDLGQRLGCGAHLIALRRTLIDHFDLKEGHTLESIEEGPLSKFGGLLIPVHKAVPSHAL
jgi:tRNA pseudouridine55 synthase